MKHVDLFSLTKTSKYHQASKFLITNRFQKKIAKLSLKYCNHWRLSFSSKMKSVRHITGWIGQTNRLLWMRPLSTSKVDFAKRRKTYPFFWLPDQYHSYYEENLSTKNEQFIKDFISNKYSLNNSETPLKAKPWSYEDVSFDDDTRRAGLLCRKIGVYPMWTKTGKRLLTTLLQVSDNHVIKYHSPEDWQRICRPFDRLKSKGLGCLVVGADSRDPRIFTAEYNGLFKESGVMPKQKLVRFFITHNARIQPGTPLLASHFRPGMFVDVYGKTVDHGLKGVRFRYKMKLGRKSHGVTKAHNRIGSIGRGRKHCGPLKGKRMPGHHGAERRTLYGLKVWRIDTRHNVLWVHGPAVMGNIGSYLKVTDAHSREKRLSSAKPPPFPTSTTEENSKLPSELFDEELHRFDEPTIIFEETEEERKAAALALRGKVGKTALKR